MKAQQPVQTELHRHLDASLRPETLLELLQLRGIEAQSTSVEAFKEKFLLLQPLENLEAVLAKFSLFQKVFDRPEALTRITFETIEDCYNEGTLQVELRFAPAFITEHNSLSWDDLLLAIQKGVLEAVTRYPDMRVGLICIAVRDLGLEKVHETLEFFLKHRGAFVGIDLAGNELGFPCREYQALFQPLLENPKAPVTIHAGEASGPENIWEAIDLLGAKRIGHGIRCVDDPELMKELARRQICLEVCPTSNWITRSVKSLEEHPLRQIIQAGVPASINTDDPGIFGITLPEEFIISHKKMGLTAEEIASCLENAFQHSFIPQK